MAAPDFKVRPTVNGTDVYVQGDSVPLSGTGTDGQTYSATVQQINGKNKLYTVDEQQRGLLELVLIEQMTTNNLLRRLLGDQPEE